MYDSTSGRWLGRDPLTRAAGKDDGLVRVQPLLALVNDWRRFVLTEADEAETHAIRLHGRTARPLGDPAFIARLESRLHRTLRKRPARNPNGPGDKSRVPRTPQVSCPPNPPNPGDSTLLGILVAGLLAAGCGDGGSSEPDGAAAGASPPVDVPPPASYDSVVASQGPLSKRQLYVTNSVPVYPGSRVDVIAEDDPPRALIVGAQIVNVRWKMDSLLSLPAYPAEGFVTLLVADNQWEALPRGGSFSIRPSKPRGK